ncbi:MAG: terpene cyclase/mutase family protein [Methanosarcinales archaeon]|nr:terpene cyclase/mutase family protein [Methanosarcinales archaeon]
MRTRTKGLIYKVKTFGTIQELDYETPFDEDYQYHENVIKGLDYIFSQAVLMDTDENSIDDAVYFGDHLVYETSIAMMAIAGSETPDRLVSVAGSAVDGWTYKKVAEYAMNYLVTYQNADGGWGYHHDGWATRSDNSNTGYAVLGLTYAQNKFSIPIPPGTLSGLDSWVDTIQCDELGPNLGGSGYETACDWVNILKTGNLLYQMAMVGDDSSTTRAIAAKNYIENHWNDANWDPGWKGPGYGIHDWPDYQATYTMMKGFEAMGIETITIDGEDVDWFDVVTTAITTTQNDDGSWSECAWGDEILSTEWALLTLEKSVEIPVIAVGVDIKPGSCPNPLNLKEKGVLPVAILGTDKLDVGTIDPTSILLSREDILDKSVPTIRCSYEDVATPFEGELCSCHDLNGDGYMDLTMKFSVPDVVATLQLGDLADGTELPLTVTGKLTEEEGGTQIQGQDCVRIINKVRDR